MDNSADNRNIKLTLKFTFSVFISTLMFSCAPRSGVHEDKEENEAWCGTESISPKLDSASGLGYKLFKQNCAVCHALSDVKLTAVGLAGKSIWIRRRICQKIERK